MRLLDGAIVAVAIVISGCASGNLRPTGRTPAASTSAAASRDINPGWYLMQPPMREGNPDPRVRLADWQVLEFFNHTAQCDAARAQGLCAYTSQVQEADSAAMNSVQLSQRLAESTLCVAADDPRINWFHFQWTANFGVDTFAEDRPH